MCAFLRFRSRVFDHAFNNDIGIQKSVRAALWDVYRAGVRWIYLTGNFLFHRRGTWHFGFFHHFAKKQGGADPTPLEVEMRTYEDDVDTTLIESGNRKEGKRQKG